MVGMIRYSGLQSIGNYIGIRENIVILVGHEDNTRPIIRTIGNNRRRRTKMEMVGPGGTTIMIGIQTTCWEYRTRK